ncbi:hypothetical protein [Asanoa sp. NPDC050611]|uniref:hypothetical protein n=1 Tax=Asanoa sp. NPDC050611 TaxID=3157098 RepID=UPI00340B33D3
MWRLLGAVALAGTVAAAVGSAQLWLAGWAGVYHPRLAFHPVDQWYGNPEWPRQLIVLAWCVSSAVLVGAAVAGPLAGRTRWRYVVAAAAALGPAAAMRLATGPATRASAGFDVGSDAFRAVVIGAVLGGLMALAIVRWRGAGRSAVVWVGWIWCTAAVAVLSYERRPDHIVPVPALTDPGWWPVAAAVVVAALLGWWAGRRADPHPVWFAVVGPVMLLAVSVGVHPLLPGGDHRAVAVTQFSAVVWSLTALAGAASAAAGVHIACGPGRTKRQGVGVRGRQG